MKDFRMTVPECLRVEILQRLFDCRCIWKDGKKIEMEFAFIYVENNIIMFDRAQRYDTFLNDPLPEITLTEFYELTEKTESENKIKKIRDLIKQALELTDG